ncbi:MAG: pyridoxal-phosphate dependent enzyme [Candidatus Hodarchaeota archaeon]
MNHLHAIEDAYRRLSGIANKTPVMTSRTLNRQTNASTYFKCENFQRVGAFKFRGAYNALSLLSSKEREKGVIAPSSGNHAQAVSLASSLLGIPATIVMPSNSSQVKVNATKEYGAKVVFSGIKPEERVKKAHKLIEESGLTLVHPYDDVNVINGAGTATYELILEVGKLDLVFCPIGGGGLISGTSIATKGLFPEARVIGVEPANADDAFRSIQVGKVLPSISPNTIADGLRTSLSERTFNNIRKYVEKIITVTEEEIINAMKFLWERMKIVVEPSGAVPLAGLLSQKVNVEEKRIGIILSGGNVDLDQFFEFLKAQ